MDFIGEVFTYKFLSNAFLASILSGLMCGVVGTYIVCRRLVFLSGGITHASFGGIGIAYYLGLSPIIGAMVFALISSFGIELVSDRGKIREDSAIGIIWSVGMSIGIIFVYMTPGYAPNLMSFLFGNILLVTQQDITMLAIFALFVIAIFALMYRPIIFSAFDREFAKSQGASVKFVSYLMAAIVALTIVLTIRMVGIVLLISLLTLPVVIANSLSKSYIKITCWAVVIAIVGNILGLYCSYTADIPAAAATIFILTLMLICVKLLPLYNKKRNR